MSTSTDYLRNSRLAAAVKKVESGDKVDWGQVAALQTLDLGVIGQNFIADAIERNDQTDEAIFALFGYPPTAPQ